MASMEGSCMWHLASLSSQKTAVLKPHPPRHSSQSPLHRLAPWFLSHRLGVRNLFAQSWAVFYFKDTVT